MPIANCILNPDCPSGSGNLIEMWSQSSGVKSEHMTINLIKCDQQLGNGYAVMAKLHLPTIWSKHDRTTLQLGLAEALSEFFAVDLSAVHVITITIDSGMVVEKGEVVKW